MVAELLLIKGGKVLIGKFWRRVLILVNGKGIIVKVMKDKDLLPYYLRHVDTILNVKERVILPGIIDMHVHFREPGLEYKEDFQTGSKAAIAGGVTIVGDMPNNNPRIKTPELLLKKAKKIEGKSFVDYVLYAEMPNDVDTLIAFKEADIKPKAIKVYYYLDEEKHTFLSEKTPKDFLYIVHAEDPSLFHEMKSCDDYLEFLRSRPVEAEISAIKSVIKKAEEGYRIHVAHVSTHVGLSLLLDAKRRGLNISFEVTPHHLIFYAEKYSHLKSLIKCFPPIRRKIDVLSLRRALRGGLIDILATDHAPHTPEEKMLDLCKAPGGIASIQWFLPLMYTLSKILWIKNPKKIIQAMTENPARRLGLVKRGKIKPGYYADLIIFNPSKRWIIKGKYTFSKAKVTPYESFRVRGFVEATILRGKLVYHKELFLKSPSGILLN